MGSGGKMKEIFGVQILTSKFMPDNHIAVIGGTCRYCGHVVSMSGVFLQRCSSSDNPDFPHGTCFPKYKIFEIEEEK